MIIDADARRIVELIQRAQIIANAQAVAVHPHARILPGPHAQRPHIQVLRQPRSEIIKIWPKTERELRVYLIGRRHPEIDIRDAGGQALVSPDKIPRISHTLAKRRGKRGANPPVRAQRQHAERSRRRSSSNAVAALRAGDIAADRVGRRTGECRRWADIADACLNLILAEQCHAGRVVPYRAGVIGLCRAAGEGVGQRIGRALAQPEAGSVRHWRRCQHPRKASCRSQ